MGAAFLGHRVDIEGSNDRYYILDPRQRRILKFDDEKYLGSIGTTGQGPGEFQHPVALSVHGDKICCIDRFSGGISVFDNEGKVKRYVRLQEQDQNSFAYIGDFEVCDQGFLVAYDKGPFVLTLYDQNGRFKQGLERKDNSYKSISHVYDITIGTDRKSAYVFSRFDSSLLIVSLPDLEILRSLKSFGTFRDDQIGLIIHDTSANSETSIHFNTFLFFSPLLIEGSKFICITSRSGETKAYTATSVDTSLDPESLQTFPITDAFRDVPHKIIYIKKVGGKILMLNELGDLYIKEGPLLAN